MIKFNFFNNKDSWGDTSYFYGNLNLRDNLKFLKRNRKDDSYPIESYDLTAEDYTGFLVFSKKLCGIDLLEKINDGRVTVSINDYGAYYSIRGIYLRVDKSHSNAVIQVTENSP